MSAARRDALLIRCAGRLCAIAIDHVVETLRPLPTVPLAGTPPFVSGAAVVRGEPLPVVVLERLVAGAESETVTRFVVVRAGTHRAVLAVPAVLGIAAVDADATASAPLLESAAGGAIETLAVIDRDLLLVLRTARMLPEETWRDLPPAGNPPRESGT